MLLVIKMNGLKNKSRGLPVLLLYLVSSKEPYLFISYAHVDGDKVYPEISVTFDHVYRI